MKTEEQFEKYCQNALAKVDGRQRQTLQSFVKSLTHTTPRTRLHYLDCLKKLGLSLEKPYEQMTKGDLSDFLDGIKKAGTYNSVLIPIKSFFKWLGREEVVKDLKQKKTRLSISPSELLTPEDVIKLASAMGDLMWKAFTLTLFESAARISEVLELRVSDVEFHPVKTKEGEAGLVATLYFKRSKGEVQKEPVAMSMFSVDLKKWWEDHPQKHNPNAYLFYAQKYDHNAERSLDITTVRAMLLRAKKITKVKKKVNPHWFRHSMLSYCVNVLNYNEQLLMWRAGWTDTQMAKRYVHSGGQLQNSAYLRKLGYVVEEEQEQKIPLPKVCRNCGTLNPQTNRLCDVCAMPLDLEEYKQVVEGHKTLEDKVEFLSRQVEMLQNVVKALAKPELNVEQMLREKSKEELSEATGEAKIPKSKLKLPE